MKKKTVTLLILDGWGESEKKEHNAVYSAKTPNFDFYKEKYPHSLLKCSGLSVGLPEGLMGNSEVGHLNIGAGRVVNQEIVRISKSIEKGDFFENANLLSAITHIKRTGGSLHLMGLLSDGGVHSLNTHLYALVELAKKNGVKDLYIHAITDGRDTSPTSGIGFIHELQGVLDDKGIGKIASISGRYYAMDRDNRWERIEKAYKTFTREGDFLKTTNAYKYIEACYKENKTDEFLPPVAVINGENGGLKEGDAIIFFNFRADRAREITAAITEREFSFFKREKINELEYICMTEYKKEFPLKLAFEQITLRNILAEVFEKNGIKNLRLAETEKYAHVTFFFNGGVEKQYKGEERILIPSPKIATYDLQPEMSAFKVKDEALKAISSKNLDCLIINFANADMVGHTGVMKAAITAVETVDLCIGEIVKAVLEQEGVVIIMADHGNAECMVDEEGNPMTAHTTNPVPCIIIEKDANYKLRAGGSLQDIAPTILNLLGIEKPSEMTGKDLRIL